MAACLDDGADLLSGHAALEHVAFEFEVNCAKRIFRLHTLKLMHTIPTTTPTRGTNAISATATSQGFAEKTSSTSGPPVSEGM